MRQKIAAGNWKMNNTLAEATALSHELLRLLPTDGKVEVVVAPALPLLEPVHRVVAGSRVKVAAQQCYYLPKGAFTGEVSVPMLASVGVSYVLVGHSERREHFGEGYELLSRKVKAVLDGGLRPIFCFGEPLSVREAGEHEALVLEQLQQSVWQLEAHEWAKLVLAYEPVWAIGTGRTATPEQAQQMHAFVRGAVATRYGSDAAEATTILYGGSCNAGNAAALFSQPDVDGGLVGGASLVATDFAAIVAALEAVA